MPLLTLPLSILDDTPARRVRARRDDDTVEDYRRARLDQRADPTLRPFPPLRVLLDPAGTHWLWDGGHRRAALLAAGDTEYPCEVEQGDLGEAVRRARKDANTDNGLRRSIEDKQAIAREICAEELDRQDRGEPPTPSRDLGALAGGTRERPALSHTFINKVLKQVREEREKAATERAEDEAALTAIRTLAPLALAAGFTHVRPGWTGEPVHLATPVDELLAALPSRHDRQGLAARLRVLVARDPRQDPRPYDVLRLPLGSMAILLAGTNTWAPKVRLLSVMGTEHRHDLSVDEYRALIAGAEIIQAARAVPDPLDSARDPRWLPPPDGHDWLGTDAAPPPPVNLLPAGWTSLESPCPASSSSVAASDASSTATATPTSSATATPAARPAATGTGTAIGELTLAQLRDRTERALNRLIKAGRTFTLRADWPTGGGEQDPAIWLDELDDTAEGELREALPVIEAASTSATPAPAPIERDPRILPERGDKVATPEDGGFVRVVDVTPSARGWDVRLQDCSDFGTPQGTPYSVGLVEWWGLHPVAEGEVRLERVGDRALVWRQGALPDYAGRPVRTIAEAVELLAVRRQEVVEQPIASGDLFPDRKALEDTIEKVARERDELRALWTAEQQEHRQTARECGDARQERDAARADLAEAIRRASAREAELLDTRAGHEHMARSRVRLLALTLGLPDLDWEQSIAEVDRLQREHRAAHALIARVLDLREGRIPDGWPASYASQPWPGERFTRWHGRAVTIDIAERPTTDGMPRRWGTALQTLDLDTRDEAERTARLWAWTLDLLETRCTPPAPPSPSLCSSVSPTSEPPSAESVDAPNPSPSTSDAAPAVAALSASTAPSSAIDATPTTERVTPPIPYSWDHLLGTMPDHEVCSRYQALTPSLVGKRRRQLKIPPYSPPRNVSAPAWAHLPGWTGTAEDLTAAVESLSGEAFSAMYKAITGVAPKARTAKTTEAACKAILRGWRML